MRQQHESDGAKGPRLELQNIKYAENDMYEICESDKGDDIQQNLASSQVVRWQCSTLRHVIEESSRGRSVVVFPHTGYVHVVVKWYDRWLSKRKNPMTVLRREELCMVEQRVTLQQFVAAFALQTHKIRTIEIANAGKGVENRQTLRNPDINLERSLVSYSSSPLLDVVITADV